MTMRETTLRIAADVLVAAIQGSKAPWAANPQKIAEAFRTIHTSVLKEAVRDIPDQNS